MTESNTSSTASTEEVVQSPAEVTPQVSSTSSKQPKYLPSVVYRFFKFSVYFLLPGASTAYVAVAQIWGFGVDTRVVQTLAAVNLGVAALIKKAKSNYNKSDTPYAGDLNVSTDENGLTTASLDLNIPHEEALAKDSLAFKVNKV